VLDPILLPESCRIAIFLLRLGPLTALDPLRIPLRGLTLIEASAGTGKTYGITTLYLRLLLELGLEVDRVLVVTFTEAATEELRDRIRGRLVQALDWFRDTGDPERRRESQKVPIRYRSRPLPPLPNPSPGGRGTFATPSGGEGR